MGISLIKISEEERKLLSDFIGEDIGSEIDFNRLMPVVEKIESIYDDHHGYFAVHISSNGCNIQGTNLWKTLEGREGYNTPDTAVYMSDPNAILGTKLESTYYNVVQFIKWYNQEKA